jgi:hypothetical protein
MCMIMIVMVTGTFVVVVMRTVAFCSTNRTRLHLRPMDA